MRVIRLLPWIAMPAFIALGYTPEQLHVGSLAPPLKVARWVKGAPVAELEKGKVYVVEFWATWCGPCRKSIPDLTELAKRFKGKVAFIGVDVWEKGEAVDIDRRVDAFVKEMGDRMDYAVARDTANSDTAKAWMMAAQQNAIPTAFIVNAAGQIAWIGHPMEDMDKVLAAVVEGKYDLTAAKAEGVKKPRANDKYTEILKEFKEPIASRSKMKDYAGVLELIQKASAKYPESANIFDGFKLIACLHCSPDQAKAMVALARANFGTNTITFPYLLVAEDGLDPSWYASAASLAEEISKRPGADPSSHALQAKALHKAGRDSEAVAAQTKAVDLSRGKEPEATTKEYEDDLKVYQEAAKAK